MDGDRPERKISTYTDIGVCIDVMVIGYYKHRNGYVAFEVVTRGINCQGKANLNSTAARQQLS